MTSAIIVVVEQLQPTIDPWRLRTVESAAAGVAQVGRIGLPGPRKRSASDL
jgi:hypothetical protein